MPAGLDETSCGPACQHPQCWASNRRIQKRIPRVLSPVRQRKDALNDTSDDFELPTLKVMNMLDDYGFDANDRFPSPDPYLFAHVGHRRSSSLPGIPQAESAILPSPPPPTTSPNSSDPSIRQGSRQIVHSAPQIVKPIPRIKKVEVHEVFDWEDLKKDWTDTFVASNYYIWCPSQKSMQKKSLKREERKKSERDSNRVKEKTISGDVLPSELQHSLKPQKSFIPRTANSVRSRRSRKTPSGGQPYTPRRRTHTEQVQMVEIGPVENIEPDGLNELLNLPRDILLEVLRHTKQSDLLSKEKIHSILRKILPQLQFHQDLQVYRGSPAVRDGQLLLNKKLKLLDGRTKHDQPLDLYHPMALYYMDDQVLSRVSTANESDDMEMKKELEVQSIEYASVSPVATETSPRKTAGIAVPSMDSINARAKITSISTQSLPPLEPGIRPTKPFMYKGNVLDLALGPVPSPEKLAMSMGIRSESPISEKDASSIHVTMPTMGSTDRSGLATPVGFYYRSPMTGPGGTSGLTSSRMPSSPYPSEDIDGTDDYPLHALSPSLSTHVPKPPIGTPNTAHAKAGYNMAAKQEESWSPGAPFTPANTPMAVGNSMPNASPSSPEKIQLRTITEANSEISASVDRERFAEALMYSPSPPPSLSVLPPKSEGTTVSWSPALANSNTHSIIPQVSDKSKPSPIQSFHTIVPEAPSPEPWPQVDERDYYNIVQSPESSKKSGQSDLAAQKLAEQQNLEDNAPAPPPPSPEPREAQAKDQDENIPQFVNENVDVGKTSSKSSLAPLQEEGEEEEEEEEEEDYDEHDMELRIAGLEIAGDRDYDGEQDIPGRDTGGKGMAVSMTTAQTHSDDKRDSSDAVQESETVEQSVKPTIITGKPLYEMDEQSAEFERKELLEKNQQLTGETTTKQTSEEQTVEGPTEESGQAEAEQK
ncbi:uncharacterized protein [Ptychodera flava]|uniref:uncharacterized protein isoform X2 n=1 Tax=Ptychodera flava TaxID=63121 RepID=UPI00396A5F9C